MPSQKILAPYNFTDYDKKALDFINSNDGKIEGRPKFSFKKN